MPISIDYPHDARTRSPLALSAAAVRAIAARVRRQVLDREATDGAGPIEATGLVRASRAMVINGLALTVAWDFDHPVHDEAGHEVLGVCETDPDMPGSAFVSINSRMVEHRPHLAISTAAHELGHVLFDIPTAGLNVRRYRAVVRSAQVLTRATRQIEARANEFMGALLTPPILLHTALLAHAREEGLRLTRAPHQGRPGSPIVARGNHPDAVAGVVAALANTFGVSDRFIAVRLSCYGLVEGGIA